MQFPSMDLGQAYFYTATILNWHHLLKSDRYKDIIMSSLRHLVQRGKIKVYAFVIMPNHIHLIWELLEMNGKEMPHVSLLKHTAHSFLVDLRQHDPQLLPYFETKGADRRHHFWQRNSLPIALYNPAVWRQKINYVFYYNDNHHINCQRGFASAPVMAPLARAKSAGLVAHSRRKENQPQDVYP